MTSRDRVRTPRRTAGRRLNCWCARMELGVDVSKELGGDDSTGQCVEPRSRLDGSIKVSVVIPTTLRSSLAQAVESVLKQDYPRSLVEVVVVVDLPRESCERPPAIPGVDRWLFTGGGARGGGARNIGVNAATGDVVAFLDDDDEWLPSKLDRQVKALRQAPERETTVVSCQYFQTGGAVPGPGESALPSRLIRPFEPVADYLFLGRRPSADRPAIPTSTLMTTRALALSVPWAERLKRHQDWDWLCQLQAKRNAQFFQVPHGLMQYTVGSTGSLSASSDWQSSLEWARSHKSSWKTKTYADFLAAQPLRYAMQMRSALGVIKVLGELIRTRRMPSLSCLVIGLAGIVPRHLFEKIMLRQRRRVQ